MLEVCLDDRFFNTSYYIVMLIYTTGRQLYNILLCDYAIIIHAPHLLQNKSIWVVSRCRYQKQ